MDLNSYARTQGRPAIFMEITDREDVGTDLRAPQSRPYRLIEEVEPGDVVLHYRSPANQIMAVSLVTGPRRSSTIVWAAKGASARRSNVVPHKQTSWEVPLGGTELLNPPLTREQVSANRERVFGLRDELVRMYGGPLHYPFYVYGGDQVRAQQAYLAVVPPEFVALFPDLERQVDKFLANDELPEIEAPEADPDDPDLYLANEEITVNRSGKIEIDPEALTRANQAHSALQNQLRTYVLEEGATLVAPSAGANVDLAYRTSRGQLRIAEVKSMTLGNEAHQIRYGLGQVIDYLDTFANDNRLAEGVLFIARRPIRSSWIRKCASVGVQLCWPGNWPE